MRIRPTVVVRRISPNRSSRNGARPTLIVVHATVSRNGPNDLANLGGWFANPAAGCSCHVGVNNRGRSGRYVDDADKAWHVAGYNRPALGIELIDPGDGSELTRDSVRECARWIARWSVKYGIPIRKAKVSGGVVTRSGVIRHRELGVIGGNHNDPVGFNLRLAFGLARLYRYRLTHAAR